MSGSRLTARPPSDTACLLLLPSVLLGLAEHSIVECGYFARF